MSRLRAALTAIVITLGLAALVQGQNAALAPFFEGVYFTNSGSLCSLCKICSYQSGTTTPLTTYTTTAANIANVNPVITDAYGRANIWLKNQSYTLELRLPGTDGSGQCPAGTGAGTIIRTVNGVLGITSVGSTNTLAKFTGANYLGNSLMTDDGTTVVTPNLRFSLVNKPSTYGAGGELYFDTSANEPRLQTSTSNLAANDFRIAHGIGFATADFVTSSAVDQVITGMVIPATIGVTYAVGATIFATAQTGGMSCALGPTNSGSTFRAASITSNGATVTTSAQSTTLTSRITQGGAGNFYVRLDGTFIGGAVSYLWLTCLPLTVDGTSLTIRKGSYIEVR